VSFTSLDNFFQNFYGGHLTANTVRQVYSDNDLIIIFFLTVTLRQFYSKHFNRNSSNLGEYFNPQPQFYSAHDLTSGVIQDDFAYF
jgi:hypothetical protein